MEERAQASRGVHINTSKLTGFEATAVSSRQVRPNAFWRIRDHHFRLRPTYGLRRTSAHSHIEVQSTRLPSPTRLIHVLHVHLIHVLYNDSKLRHKSLGSSVIGHRRPSFRRFTISKYYLANGYPPYLLVASPQAQCIAFPSPRLPEVRRSKPKDTSVRQTRRPQPSGPAS